MSKSEAAKKGWETRRRNIAFRASPMGKMAAAYNRYAAARLVQQIERARPILKMLLQGSKP